MTKSQGDKWFERRMSDTSGFKFTPPPPKSKVKAKPKKVKRVKRK